jgi:CBS domain-containing protein
VKRRETENPLGPPLPPLVLPGLRREPVMDLAKNLKIDSVSRLHPTRPLQVAPAQTVAEAVALMRHDRVGCVLVCDGGRLVGIFTERDLLRRVLGPGRPLSLPVREVMTPNPVAVHPKEPIGVAVRRMEEGGYRHLPVVDEAGRPVGVVSVKRIVHYLVEHFPATVYNLPPDPDAVPNAPEGA